MNGLQSVLLVTQGVCALIAIFLILIHSPKSDGAGLTGGLSSSFTTQRGAENTLNAITRVVVGAFLIVSFVLGYYF
jgi:protein translocase SecG subunit